MNNIFKKIMIALLLLVAMIIVLPTCMTLTQERGHRDTICSRV